MQKQSFAIIRQSSTKIDQASFAKFVEQCCHINMTAVFDNIFIQYSTTFDKKILSNAVEKCWMPSIAGEKWCQKILSTFDNIFRQLFSTKFYRIWQIFCQIMSKFVLCCQKILAKNAVKKCCRIIIRQYFLTNFYSKFLGLFVN